MDDNKKTLNEEIALKSVIHGFRKQLDILVFSHAHPWNILFWWFLLSP